MHRSLNANPWENYFLPSEFGAKYQNDVKFVCQGEGTKLPNSIIRPQDWRERPFRRGEALQPPQCNAADRTKAVKAACRESQNEWLMSFGPPTTRERERERESHSPRTADKQMGSCKLGITSLLRSEKEEE